jgi:hypothetical protein
VNQGSALRASLGNLYNMQIKSAIMKKVFFFNYSLKTWPNKLFKKVTKPRFSGSENLKTMCRSDRFNKYAKVCLLGTIGGVIKACELILGLEFVR